MIALRIGPDNDDARETELSKVIDAILNVIDHDALIKHSELIVLDGMDAERNDTLDGFYDFGPFGDLRKLKKKRSKGKQTPMAALGTAR